MSCLFSDISFSSEKEKPVLSKFDYKEVSNLFNEDYEWQCSYIISDEKYHLKDNNESSLVDLFEVDENSLYIKSNGSLTHLNLDSHTDTEYRYKDIAHNIEVDINIKKKFNSTEYDESHDRNVDITIVSGKWNISMNAVGLSCGI